jgi:hypothetical protein
MNELKKELCKIKELERTNSFTITLDRMNAEGRFYRLYFAHGPMTIVFHKKRYVRLFKEVFTKCLFGSGCSESNPVIDITRMNNRLIELEYYKYFYIKGDNIAFSGDITNIPELFNYIIKEYK